MTKLNIANVANYFGGIPKLAKALGINVQAIYQWRKHIPASRAYQIEVLTKGRFKAAKLVGKITPKN